MAWHHDYASVDAIDPTDPQYGDTQPQQVLEDGSLGTWGPGFGESGDRQRLRRLQGRPHRQLGRSVPADHELPDVDARRT